MAKFGLAQPVRRVEDFRLLVGAGRYTDDIVLPGLLHGIVLRSPHAAARINNVDTTTALSLDGVTAIYTAADLIANGSYGAFDATALSRSRFDRGEEVREELHI